MHKSFVSSIVATALIASSVTALPVASAQTKEASSSSDLKLDPTNDPLSTNQEGNPLQAVSSSDMFLDLAKGMEPGPARDAAIAWARGSSIPNTVNPIELSKQELQGSSMMFNGLTEGDWAQSSRGSSQATSVMLTIAIGSMVVGQLIELLMRGLRTVQR
ncbi:hypothetical protein [Corynebacterium glaucum]|uniref:hypothetical protein n=1 Tax=Corynebacterium glaucum TaxID=187491 RepID=UPI002658A266|nr:hypothetical protein [Corynebacterium glaucum]